MGSSITALTDRLKNFLDGVAPAHGNPLATEASNVLLGSRLADMDAVQSNTAVIPNGSTSVVLAIGEAYDGKPAVASIAESGTSALYVKSVEWNGSGSLTVTVDQDPGADLTIAWMVDGR